VIKGDSPESHARRRARRRMQTVGYRLSQRVRKRCEQIIGWGKTVAGLARTRFVGLVRIEKCGAAGRRRVQPAADDAAGDRMRRRSETSK